MTGGVWYLTPCHSKGKSSVAIPLTLTVLLPSKHSLTSTYREDRFMPVNLNPIGSFSVPEDEVAKDPPG